MNLFYYIVGPVSDSQYYEFLKKNIDQYNLKNRVKFYPPVKKSAVSKWYSFADVMVLVSKVEGISMALIEAQAAALPLLVSKNVANANEIHQDKAGIVIDTKIEPVISGLEKCMSSPQQLKSLSINAIKSAQNRYDINKVANLMVEAYENILIKKLSKKLN